MKDWVEKLDGFLQFNEYEILTNPGSVSHEVAQDLAEGEYEKFRAIRDHEILSDFEREVKRLGSGKRPGETAPQTGNRLTGRPASANF